MAVDLVFTRSSGFVAWCIRALTGGRASHVGIRLGPDEFIHADQGGVKLSTKFEFLDGGSRKIIRVYRVQPHVASAFDREAALSLVGRPYDYDSILGFVPVVLLRRWFGIRVKNPFADTREYICSEFACSPDVWRQRDLIPEFSSLDAEEVDPAWLMHLVARGRSFTKVPKPW